MTNHAKEDSRKFLLYSAQRNLLFGAWGRENLNPKEFFFLLRMLFMPEILALRQLRQNDHKFRGSVGYTERPYLKKQTTKKKLPPSPFKSQCYLGSGGACF